MQGRATLEKPLITRRHNNDRKKPMTSQVNIMYTTGLTLRAF